MGTWFRSEPMRYVSLIIHEDASHAVASALGRTGAIQFTDLNPDTTPFQKRFVSYIKRCDELERKLRFFAAQVQEMGLKPQSAGSIDQVRRERNLKVPGARKGTRRRQAEKAVPPAAPQEPFPAESGVWPGAEGYGEERQPLAGDARERVGRARAAAVRDEHHEQAPDHGVQREARVPGGAGEVPLALPRRRPKHPQRAGVQGGRRLRP
eukprot:scaffold5523_cov250-Pinguiococcus_pyrenoidosus.AAC.1